MPHFLFESPFWKGRATIIVHASPQALEAEIIWRRETFSSKRIEAIQIVTIPELHTIENRYIFTFQEEGHFSFDLISSAVETHSGIGMMGPSEIIWKYTSPNGIEGHELYKKKSEGGYEFEAQYSGEDGVGTSIEGNIYINQ